MNGLHLVRGDITTTRADAVVNAANAALAGGSGVDGAIHRVGGPEIARVCRALGGCRTGDAVVTTAGRLPARYVIHAVAPIYRGSADDARLLRGAYAAAFARAEELGLASIAFPSLGTGAYGYPIEQAAPLALATIRAALAAAATVRDATFVLFSDADLAAYRQALAQLPASPP